MSARAVQLALLIACLVLLLASFVAPRTLVRTKRTLMLAASLAGTASVLVGAS